jgi:hypothetical protein
MMTGNTAIHIASQLQSGAPRKAAFLVAVPRTRQNLALSRFGGSALTDLRIGGRESAQQKTPSPEGDGVLF